MMRLNLRCHALFIACGMAFQFSSVAFAVPYASGVRNTGGANWEYVLNEAADVVTIKRDGGNPIVLNNATVGRHTFSMTGFTNFEIAVSKNAPVGFTELSTPANIFTRFERPTGLAVNSNPASPYFGTIYVGQATNLSTAAVATATPPIPARTMAEGIYALTADQVGIDLANNFAAVADPQSTAQSKKPASWITDDTFTVPVPPALPAATADNARSPWRFSLDEGGNLIVADWSINTGGMKWASPNLTSGGPLLAVQDGEDAAFPIRNTPNMDDLHSRHASAPYVTGRIGNNLTVTSLDVLLEATVDVPTPVLTDRLNVWKWNIGNHDFTANPQGYDGGNTPPQPDFIVPNLVIKGIELNRIHGPAQTQATGTQWFNSVPTVLADLYYSPQHDLYYLTQPRSNGDQPSLLIVDANLDGDPTGATPIVLFNSREWTRDHGMDGAIGVAALGGPTPETERNGEDIFRMASSIELSPDGKTMFLRRQQIVHITAPATQNETPVLGMNSNAPFNVLTIPLDQNGLPIINIDTKGTPETTDDIITNFGGFATINPTAAPAAHEIELDAAGNVYTTHSTSEVLQIFSPGGSWTATTTSAGLFSLTPFVPPSGGVAGDYNNNGVVDAADYVVWRDALGSSTQLMNEGSGVTPGSVTQEDYATWKANFGKTPAGAGAASNVPEPCTSLLVLMAGCAFTGVRRRG